MGVKCLAAKSAKQSLVDYAYDPVPLGCWDIEVAISHCGICYSDVHLIDNDWGNSIYPLVPGHEIIGHITAMGSDMHTFKIGQRVGIGWQRSSCMQCEWCGQGEENLCSLQEATCLGHPGGFSERIRADGRFAFAIPEELTSEQAAPLLCGGATVYSPLIQHGVQPTHRVGVIGIGGLGHLALQFARAFGCEVTAISHSAEKKAEAEKFGAHHFIQSSDKEALEKAANSFDFLLCTISAPQDWDIIANLLRPKGVLCFVGAQTTKPLSVGFGTLLHYRRSITVSNIASRPQINDMLRLAALHGIRAQIELFPLKDANQAIAKLRAGKIRYRAVLHNTGKD